MVVHPTGKFVYVLSSRGIVAYSVAPGSGALIPIQGSPFHSERSPEKLALDPGGKFLFVANTFSVSISVYSVNPDSGALTAVQGSPFHSEGSSSGLAVDPSGKFLYSADAFDVFSLFPFAVSAYTINATTGALTQISGSPFQTAVGPQQFVTRPGPIAIHNLPAPPPPAATTSLAPSSATAGGAGFTLTVTGTGFVSGATVQWNGAPLATMFLSATQLTAVVPASLIATAGSASVTVSSPGGMASKAVAFTINPIGIAVSANGVVNGASRVGGAVSPGEIVTISGAGFGPGAQALFDGVAAPLLSAQAGQLTVVVPYGVSGNPSTQLQISYQGQSSSAIAIPVAVAAPGIFSVDASGSGQGIIFNEDGTANAPGNPASPGATVVVSATGEGQTIPVGLDGKPGDSPAPVPIQTVTATIGGLEAPVVAASGVSGQVAGYFQVSVQIPADVTVGDSVPIVLNIGGIASQANVTLAVQ